MDTLDRYLLKEFSLYFIVILFLLASLFLGIDFFSNIWELRLGPNSILAYYGYKAPGVLNQVVPIACLMASLLTISQMSRQNEVLALYASGVGSLRILSTLIAIVAVLSTISFLVFDSVVPLFNRRLDMVKRGLDPNEELPTVQIGGLWYRSGNLIYKVGHLSAETGTMENLNIYLLNTNFELFQKVSAPLATYDGSQWTAKNGFVLKFDLDTHFPMGESFKTRPALIPERPTDFKTFHIQEEQMRLRDLRKLIQKNSAFGMDTTAEKVNYHERLALVFTPLIFVLLGLPFTLKPLRNYSMPKSIAFCFLIVFVYLIFFRFSLSLGKGGHIPALIAGWAPNLAFLLVSLVVLFRKR